MRIPRKMKKNNKANPLILVYYIKTGALSPQKVKEYMHNISVEMKMDNKRIGLNSIQYFIPVIDQETKVECINPVLVNKDVYKGILDRLEETKSKLDKLLINND